jgi:small-conductance mechanosensitive channel
MEKLFSADFWSTLSQKGMEWFVTEFPGLLITIILFMVLLRVIGFSIGKLRKTFIHRADMRDKIDSLEAEKRISTLTAIIHGIVKIVLWVVIIMIVLQKFGINIAPFLAGAGIIGLAVGFGAQELVRDFITGFFMILENQIRRGDVAVINGTGGLVEKIEFRTITLRDFSGTVHVFQNGKISTLSNMTKDWSAMVFDIGVAYKENIEKVMDLMKQVGDQLKEDKDFNDKIIEPIEIFGVNEFGDSAIIIKARLKTKPIQQWTVGREYRKRLKETFDQHNIEIPFPHTTVYWGEEINPLELQMKKAS